MGADKGRCVESMRRLVDESTGETVWSGYRLDEALVERRRLRGQGVLVRVETVGVDPRGDGGRLAAA